MRGNRFWSLGWSACPGCGSLASGRGLVCGTREGALRAKGRPAIDIAEGWTHRFVFDWFPGEDDVLSNLLLAMKGAGAGGAWDRWAETFIRFHGDHLPDLGRIVLVTAPHADPLARDHSSHFAEALAGKLGLAVAGRPLIKETGRSSRTLSKSERFRRKDLVKNAVFRRPRGRRFVLIDDVLTTGATARAVKHALGSPYGFEVWSLAARRTSSCGALGGVIGI